MKRLAFAIAVLGALNCTVRGEDFDDQFFRAGFYQIRIGMTGEAVSRLVAQTPQSEEITRVLNLSITRWHWRVGATGFLVVLISNHVIATKRCSEAAIVKC